jgi:hypothetical protein
MTMTTLEEVERAIVAAEGDCALSETEAEDLIERVRADAQALVDVRTLDDWATSNKRQVPSPEPSETRPDVWMVVIPAKHSVDVRVFEGPTPEAARAKAAAWVREQAVTSRETTDRRT